MSTDAPRGLDANIIMVRIRSSKLYVFFYIKYDPFFFETDYHVLVTFENSRDSKGCGATFKH
jgi:hypothetical protein